MYLLYSLLLTLGFIFLLPRFLLDAFRKGKYIAGFRERLGSFQPPFADDARVIWLHAVSVGEAQAARPLAELLLKSFPDHKLVLSTITLTGQNLARQIYNGKAARVFYFPFDWRWTVRRTLRQVRPAAVLLMETELWPNFLRECSSQQIPVALVNGRLSAKSARRYSLVKGFISRVVSDLDLAIMQTERDGKRLEELGYPAGRIFIAGNLKFDAGAGATRTDLTETLAKRFGLDSQSNLILAASTHAPEERMVIESFRRVREKLCPKPRLMVVPRHPERFAEVAGLLKDSGLKWKRRTEPATEIDSECDVILLDTIGELAATLPLACLVFVGGSIVNFGGHNILEPAAARTCIITGPHTHNFEAIIEAFVEARAIVQLSRLHDREVVVELSRVMDELLQDSERRKQMAERASNLIKENLGAADRTVELLKRSIFSGF